MTPGARPRVLVAGHSFVNALNRERIDALARRDDVDVHLLTPDRWLGSHDESYDLRTPPPGAMPHHVLPIVLGGRNRHQLYLYRSGLARTIAAVSPDLLLAEEEPYSAVTFQLALAARAAGIPFVFWTHQNVTKRFPPPFCWMESFVFGRSSAAIVSARPTAEVLEEKRFTARVDRVPLSIDLARFTPDPARPARAALGLAGPVIGFVGRLAPLKGVQVLLEAFARLALPATLLLVGSGPERGRLGRLASTLGIDRRVRWVDAVGHAEVPAYLNACDCVVLPSVTLPTVREQFGRILIEAMACEVAVVGADSGSIPEVVGEAGLLVPEQNAAALADALSRILSDHDLRRSLGRAGRLRVRDRFTHDAAAAPLARLVREVVLAAPGPGGRPAP